MHGKASTDSSLAFAPDEVRGMFRRAASGLGLEAELALFSLRRGGASGDRLSLRRARRGVKDRGGWRADQSLLRCAKRARMQRRIASLGRGNRGLEGLIVQTVETGVFP